MAYAGAESDQTWNLPGSYVGSEDPSGLSFFPGCTPVPDGGTFEYTGSTPPAVFMKHSIDISQPSCKITYSKRQLSLGAAELKSRARDMEYE